MKSFATARTGTAAIDDTQQHNTTAQQKRRHNMTTQTRRNSGYRTACGEITDALSRLEDGVADIAILTPPDDYKNEDGTYDVKRWSADIGYPKLDTPLGKAIRRTIKPHAHILIPGRKYDEDTARRVLGRHAHAGAKVLDTHMDGSALGVAAIEAGIFYIGISHNSDLAYRDAAYKFSEAMGERTRGDEAWA
jgi:DNA modification methylase